MSDVIDNEYRTIGRAGFHTGNSGLYMTILDKGFGPTLRWTVSSMSLTSCSFEINVDPSVFEQLMWLSIGAATNPKDYPDNILDPPGADVSFGNREAALLYDQMSVISPTGKVVIGYKADPNLQFYIEGKSHGVPSFEAHIKTTRMAFVDLAQLFWIGPIMARP